MEKDWLTEPHEGEESKSDSLSARQGTDHQTRHQFYSRDTCKFSILLIREDIPISQLDFPLPHSVTEAVTMEVGRLLTASAPALPLSRRTAAKKYAPSARSRYIAPTRAQVQRRHEPFCWPQSAPLPALQCPTYGCILECLATHEKPRVSTSFLRDACRQSWPC